jgi:hypothetical protein
MDEVSGVLRWGVWVGRSFLPGARLYVAHVQMRLLRPGNVRRKPWNVYCKGRCTCSWGVAVTLLSNKQGQHNKAHSHQKDGEHDD